MSKQTSTIAHRDMVQWGGVDIELTAKHRASGIRLTRSVFSPLAVTYPENASIERVREFVENTNLYRRAKRIVDNPIENAILDGHQVHSTTFRFRPSQGTFLETTQTKEGVSIFVPAALPVDSYIVQQYAFQVLKSVARYEANRLIPQLVRQEAKRLGLVGRYGHIRIKDMESRWGSCSSKGNLNFSLYLALCTPEAMRYTVLHELAHLTHLNHEPAFWDLLTSYLDEDAQLVHNRTHQQDPNIPRIY
ncbi:MAG: hypothetical protein CSA97_01350 [Bacteroidetes bacterium]|nr:MAG: hypothetical protein CSA97_01350 [Bacteroidota bacterium]